MTSSASWSLRRSGKRIGMPSEGPTSEVLDFRKMPAFSMSGENRAMPGTVSRNFCISSMCLP